MKNKKTMNFLQLCNVILWYRMLNILTSYDPNKSKLQIFGDTKLAIMSILCVCEKLECLCSVGIYLLCSPLVNKYVQKISIFWRLPLHEESQKDFILMNLQSICPPHSLSNLPLDVSVCLLEDYYVIQQIYRDMLRQRI